VHRYEPLHEPLLPDVTSLSEPAFVYVDCAYVSELAFPASAYTPATTGAATLVPPTVPQPLKHWPTSWLKNGQFVS
jgi:hypothetical protein